MNRRTAVPATPSTPPTLPSRPGPGRSAAGSRWTWLAVVSLLLPVVLSAPAAPADPAADRFAPLPLPVEPTPTTGPTPPAPVPPDLPVGAVAGVSRSGRGHATGHVVVRFRSGLEPWQEEAVAAGLGSRRLDRARHGTFARVEVPPGETPERTVARFRQHPSVAWAGVDPLFRAAYTGFAAAPADVTSVSDPFFPFQWHLERIGLEEALARNPRDGEGIVVAVLDSGVAFGSGTSFPARPAPDLSAVTFLPGWDFIDDDPVPFDLGTVTVFRGDPNRDPRFGHGTFAATIIAATVNNGLAGTGVAPRVSILPVRVLDVDGFGTGSGIAEGIRFAVDSGAHVINLSLGGASRFEPGADAVRYALRNGVVVVAAAGNEADDPAFEEELGNDVAYPARFPEVIAVGATDFDDQRAAYSNFGPNLDLMAPAGANVGRELPGNLRDAVLSTSFVHFPATGETTYGGFWANGTSFAAPQVAGAAALLMSLGVDDPETVRTMLRLTARDLDGGGFDRTTGHGLLDAASAHRGLGFTR